MYFFLTIFHIFYFVCKQEVFLVNLFISSNTWTCLFHEDFSTHKSMLISELNNLLLFKSESLLINLPNDPMGASST